MIGTAEKRKGKYTIRQLIILSYIFTFIITAGLITFMTFYTWKKSIDNTINELENDMNDEIVNEIDDIIRIPLSMNEINHYIIQNKIVDFDNAAERGSFFAGVVQASSDEIYSVSYGSENGDYYGARRNENNELELYYSNSETNGHSYYYSVTNDLQKGHFLKDFGLFDPRTREWYKLAKLKGTATFAPLYKHFVKDDLVLSAAYPIYHDGMLQGVLGTHITLTSLSLSLRDIVQSRMGNAFIVEADGGAVVANSLGVSNFLGNSDGTYERVNLSDITEDYIDEAYQAYLTGKTKTLLADNEKGKIHVKTANYNKNGLNWIIITSIPENIFVTDINRQMQTALALLIIAILVSILIYIYITNLLMKPINNLIFAADRFAAGDLTQRAKIYGEDEIGKLAKSYNHMADELHLYINRLEEKVSERTTELEQAVSKLKTSNKELSCAIEKAEEANIAKSQFLANMSHEIRTPMNGILGFLQLLESTGLNEDQSEYIHMIKSSSDSLLTVINDILDISKIEAGMLKLEQIPFELRSIIETVATLFGARAQEKGLEIHLQIQANVPYHVVGDPIRLRQIINNLISNAIKFTNTGGIYMEVSVTNEENDRVEVTFRIRDTGIGMSNEDMNKLFKPFSQADTSTTREYGGTGLGLSICKRIIDLMGGSISVTSKKWEGSTFYFSIPFIKNGINTISTTPGPEAEPYKKEGYDSQLEKQNHRNELVKLINTERINTERKEGTSIKEYGTTMESGDEIRNGNTRSEIKILLVEDNDINKKFFVKLLQNHDLFCDVVSNGVEALNIISMKDYDLVFMDCQMPVLDGYETTKQIRKREGSDKHTIIIAMTAFAMKGDAEKCLEAGMDEYISKPIMTDQLLNIVNKYTKKYLLTDNTQTSTNDFDEVVTSLMTETKFSREESEEIVIEFYKHALDIIEKSKELLAEDKLEEVRICLHQLKGSAANIRAKAIVPLVKKAEEEIGRTNKKQNYSTLEELKALINRLAVYHKVI